MSNFCLEGKPRVIEEAIRLKQTITPMGYGSGISFTKETPIVKNLETKIIAFVAVDFCAKGNILSS